MIYLNVGVSKQKNAPSVLGPPPPHRRSYKNHTHRFTFVSIGIDELDASTQFSPALASMRHLHYKYMIFVLVCTWFFYVLICFFEKQANGDQRFVGGSFSDARVCC